MMFHGFMILFMLKRVKKLEIFRPFVGYVEYFVCVIGKVGWWRYCSEKHGKSNEKSNS